MEVNNNMSYKIDLIGRVQDVIDNLEQTPEDRTEVSVRDFIVGRLRKIDPKANTAFDSVMVHAESLADDQDSITISPFQSVTPKVVADQHVVKEPAKDPDKRTPQIDESQKAHHAETTIPPKKLFGHH